MFVFGSALVLWGASERTFWSLVRPDEIPITMGIVFASYVVATYFTLWAALGERAEVVYYLSS